MSSNESTSSSRLSQFGLYRTIDARTEEFLKLSRQRQIRQGCACAAVSTAVTVTVVVSILFLYGYGVSSSASTAQRVPGWLDLMNDSTDTTPFDENFQNSFKFDRNSMNLLPVYFDKTLDEQKSSSLKHEDPLEMNDKRSLLPGSTNQFLAQAKLPSLGSYSIQYKTFPVLYIQSPRNTEYYMKVRKTREYERIRSYIDKMISDKVGLGTRSLRNLQYPMSTEKYAGNSRTVPMAAVRKTVTPKVITKQKESKSTKFNPSSNKNSIQFTVPNVKFNSTIAKNKNCKCPHHFGTILHKILKCFQDLVEASELPCNKKTPKNTAVQIKNQNTTGPTSAKTTQATTTIVSAVTGSIPSTTTTPNIKATTTTITNTTNNKDTIFTSTESPTEIFHFSNGFLQKPLIPNDNKIKPKELLSQMSPYYIMTENHNSKKTISKSNILAPLKPKKKILSTNNCDSYAIQTHKENNLKLSITEKNVEQYFFRTGTSTTTTSPEKSDEIFQNLLFPETKEVEYARLSQRALKKYSPGHILRPRSRERVTPVIKPETTTQPPISSTFFSLMQDQIEKRKSINTENIFGKTKSRPHAPVELTKDRASSVITPEDYVMERVRHENKKQSTSTSDSSEPITLQENKSEKINNSSVFDKIKNLLKTKITQPYRKTSYGSLSARIMKSKTEPKYVESKSTNSFQKINYITEHDLKNSFENLLTAFSSTTTYSIIPSTTHIPLVTIGSTTSPTQLKQYSFDTSLPEITTQPSIKDSNDYRLLQKLGRRNTQHNSREDIWIENDEYKTALNDGPHEDIKITTAAAPENNYVSTTTTESVIHVVKNSSSDSKEIQTASVDVGLNKTTSLQNNDNNASGSSQTGDNYSPYMTPVGRKSYLEISRGDWKQNEPCEDDTNIYDAIDDMDGI